MINEFISRLTKEGVYKPSRFVVEFVNVPSAVDRYAGELLRDMRFYVEAAEFPGIRLLTQEFRYYDIQQRTVYGRTNDDVSLSVRLDRNMKLKTFFTLWAGAAYESTTGNVYFRDDYAGTVRITAIDEFGNAPYSIELEEAFPIEIGSLEIGWDQTDTYAKLPVTLAYRTWWIVTTETPFTPSIVRQVVNQNPFTSLGSSFKTEPNLTNALAFQDGSMPGINDALLTKLDTGRATKIVKDKGQALVQKYARQLRDRFSLRT